MLDMVVKLESCGENVCWLTSSVVNWSGGGLARWSSGSVVNLSVLKKLVPNQSVEK